MRTESPAFRAPRAAQLSPLAAAIALALAPGAGAATFTVTTNADSGTGSLREAIQLANGACGGDLNPTINFSGGPFTIALSSQLPTLFCNSGDFTPTIDGGGTPASPNVTLSGASSGAACGLHMTQVFPYGGALTVTGLKVHGFTNAGNAAGLCGSLNVRGSLITANNIGIQINGGNVGTSQVGGPLAADRNVITSNNVAGVLASGVVHVENNFIGTGNGSTAAPNGKGVFITAHPSTVTGNVIAGNTGIGVDIFGDYGGTLVTLNSIGVNAFGNPLGNGDHGVRVTESNRGSIDSNTIGGNAGAGIFVSNSSFLDIHDNLIGLSGANEYGVDAYCSGYLTLIDNMINSNTLEGVRFNTVDMSIIAGGDVNDNGDHGIRLDDGLDCSYSGFGNTIVPDWVNNNGLNGILVVGGTGNLIEPSMVYGNGQKNINLNRSPGTAALPNDLGDTDGGPNEQQNWPRIDSVVQGDGQTVINYTIDSNVGTYRIRAFSNPTFGKPAAHDFMGSMLIDNFYGGPVSGTLFVEGIVDNISLTATNTSTNNTSELSTMAAASTGPAVLLSQTEVNFGNVQVGQSSTERTVVARSTGDAPWVIDMIEGSGFCYGGPICYGGGFICSTTCETGTEYAKGQTCQVKASFAPSFTGFQSTTINFCDNTGAGINTITLSGNAVPPPPVRISPTAWDFGSVPVGTSSAPKGFTIINDYGGTIPIAVVTSGEFDVVADGCGGSVSSESPCNVLISFGPTQSGEAVGDVRVNYNPDLKGVAAKGVAGFTLSTTFARATLTGIGTAGGELILPSLVSVGSAVFGGQAVSTTVELRNNGTTAVNIASITVSAPFTLVNNCPAVLEAGQACTLTVGFLAPGVGPFNGILTVVTDAEGGSAEIPVTAQGQTAFSPLLRVQPTTMGFGDRIIGSASPSQQVTITNIGGAAATLNLATSTIDYRLTSNSCAATLEPNATCVAQVGFRPLGFGPRTGSLVVTSNTANSPQAVTLGGTGCRPFMASGNRFGDTGPGNCAP